MKAYILRGKDNAGWEEVPTPKIDEFDALIKVTAVATCTTDVHQIETAALPTLLGKALGHEAVGVVEKVGNKVKDFKPGDRVVIPVAWSDFRHPKAQRHEAKFYQTNSPYFSNEGLNGHFAEYVKVVDADMALAKIPDSVTAIKGGSISSGYYGAFYGCTSLKSIEIPDSVTTIGPSAFYGCTSLQNVEISASLTTIGEYAFYGCTSLKSVYIPASVTTIEQNAFKECTNLLSVVFEDIEGWSPQVSNLVETTKRLVLGYSFTKS